MLLGILGGTLAAAVTLFMGAGFWSALAAYVVTGFCIMTGVLLVQLMLHRSGIDLNASDTDRYRDRLAEDYSQWIDDPETQDKVENQDDDLTESRVA